MNNAHKPDKQQTARYSLRILMLKLLLAGVLIGLMMHFDVLNIPRIIEAARAKPLHLAGAAALLMAGLLLTIARWRALLAVQEIEPGACEVFRLGFIGFFFSCMIPGSVSGDAVKAYYVVKDHGKTAGSVTSVLLDRIIGLYTLVLTATISIAILRHVSAFGDIWGKPVIIATRWLVFALAAGMTLFFAAVLSNRARNSSVVNRLLNRLPLQRHVHAMYDAVHLYRNHKRKMAVIVGLSFAAQVPMILSHYMLGELLDAGALPLIAYFFLASVGLIINSIPVLPAGIGTGEAGYAVLFLALGSTIGAEVAALWHVIFIGWSGIGLVLYLKGKKRYSQPVE